MTMKCILPVDFSITRPAFLGCMGKVVPVTSGRRGIGVCGLGVEGLQRFRGVGVGVGLEGLEIRIWGVGF